MHRLENKMFQLPDGIFHRTGLPMGSNEWQDLKQDVARGLGLASLADKYRRDPEELRKFTRSMRDSNFQDWEINPTNSGKTWTDEDHWTLVKMCKAGRPLNEIASKLKRTVYAIQCKIESLPPNSLRPDPNFKLEEPQLSPTSKKEEPKMSAKTNHIISLLQSGYTTIGCCFPQIDGTIREGSRKYTYKTTDLNLKVDDLVLVKTGNDLKVVKVMEVHATPQIDIDSSIHYTWIIQKIDTTHYDSLLKKEDEFAESLQAIEKEKRKAQMVADFKEFMPKEAQPLLNQAIENLTGKETN
jgi:hypothetical protein